MKPVRTVTRAQFLGAVEPKDWPRSDVELGDFVSLVLRDDTIDLTPRLMAQLDAVLSSRRATLTNIKRLAA